MDTYSLPPGQYDQTLKLFLKHNKKLHQLRAILKFSSDKKVIDLVFLSPFGTSLMTLRENANRITFHSEHSEFNENKDKIMIFYQELKNSLIQGKKSPTLKIYKFPQQASRVGIQHESFWVLIESRRL